MYVFTSLDDQFENLGEINVLACKMFTSGFRLWLKNVACLTSLYCHYLQNVPQYYNLSDTPASINIKTHSLSFLCTITRLNLKFHRILIGQNDDWFQFMLMLIVKSRLVSFFFVLFCNYCPGHNNKLFSSQGTLSIKIIPGLNNRREV